MRLLIVNHHRTLVGGVETYLSALMPALAAAGHEIFFLHEVGENEPGPPIALPPNARSFAATDLSKAFAAIEAWRPDIAYMHAMHNLELQGSVIDRFPSIAFAHGYYGLCISGSKTWKRAPAQPCERLFGLKCLLHFHAKNCGGSSPVTMWRDFRRQSRQLKLLRRCDAVLTHGGQLEAEYLAQGVARHRLVAAPHFVEPPRIAPQQRLPSETVKLIYVGRFDELKGGALLIEALPQIAEELHRPVHLDMVGAGPAGNDWRARGEKISGTRVNIEFHGWLERDAKDLLIAKSDLLVVPSVWPEPFGQVGLEAACLGVPAVAFDVGGISTWLREGINGHLSAANPPTSAALAGVIRKSLESSNHYAKLRAGALEVAHEFSVGRHARALEAIFQGVLKKRR
jgi:glycosyltransferase involved in cell wall biosynthesis